MNRFMKKVCCLLIFCFLIALIAISVCAIEFNSRLRLEQISNPPQDGDFSWDTHESEDLAVEAAIHLRTDLGETVIPSEEETTVATEIPEEILEQKTIFIESIPLIFQTDYPTTLYATGTVATSGCGVTCLSMVASYMTNHLYLPDKMVCFLDEFTGSHMEVLEYGSDLLQLPWEKAENAHVAINALKEGKIVIALMNSNSIFTTGQHFIVLTGITEEGRILVNDPNANNYDHWRLKTGFEDGFVTVDITNGFSGGWIYDPSAMPEEPFIYEEEEEFVEPRYPEISLTAEEATLLAKIVWLEARGECFEGQQAVAEVVFNRMVSEHFPDTLHDVLFADGQFPTTNFLDTAEPTRTQYEAVRKALYGPYILPIEVMYFARSYVNQHEWGRIGGHVFCYY